MEYYEIVAYAEEDFKASFIAGGIVQAYSAYVSSSDYRTTIVDRIVSGYVHVSLNVEVDTVPAAVALTEHIAYVAGVEHVRLTSEDNSVIVSMER